MRFFSSFSFHSLIGRNAKSVRASICGRRKNHVKCNQLLLTGPLLNNNNYYNMTFYNYYKTSYYVRVLIVHAHNLCTGSSASNMNLLHRPETFRISETKYCCWRTNAYCFVFFSLSPNVRKKI
jgi:hypothetical protein